MGSIFYMYCSLSKQQRWEKLLAEPWFEPGTAAVRSAITTSVLCSPPQEKSDIDGNNWIDWQFREIGPWGRHRLFFKSLLNNQVRRMASRDRQRQVRRWNFLTTSRRNARSSGSERRRRGSRTFSWGTRRGWTVTTPTTSTTATMATQLLLRRQHQR